MKFFFASILFIGLSLTIISAVNAQSAETIWIQTNITAYKTGETITVMINGATARPIQGFTAQIRYDPACLQPVSGISPISGMNGLALPQVSGLVDISFASTTPQIANGELAELRFTALKGCQTNLTIETAALVIRNESGFAVPLPGVNIDQKAITINIDSAAGSPQPAITGEAVLPLTPNISSEHKPVNIWVVVSLLLLFGIVNTTIVVLFIFRQK